ncbi:PqiC family protein [Variovorax sp. J22R133]|uniref:PqiC family protein n=1 Tax=Variovorax brevis TaxID=3053503 RepID=UPI0025774058|nr:PqiC family protein [Variovorax sp. J22R133]MDM0111036.1 PqiC family protein [Variovorax sp. J22R133]
MKIACRRQGLARRVLAAVPALVLMAGCAGTPTRYYTLAEPSRDVTSAPATATAARASSGERIYFEVSPIAMPERFARPQMVVRRQNEPDAQVEILEQSRWSSSFESELRDALAAGIASRLSAVDVTKSGQSRGQPVYRVVVQMGQFDAVEGGKLDGAFSWTLRRTDEEPLVTCNLRVSEALSGGLEGVAQGARRVTGRLADGIAGSVASMAGRHGARCPVEG